MAFDRERREDRRGTRRIEPWREHASGHEPYRGQGYGALDPRGEDRNFAWNPAATGAPDFRGRGPRGYRRSDGRIREDVCECLTEDRHLDASDIEVAVSDCEVTLSGTVQSRADKRRAEALAEGVAGVRDVHNTLRIASGAVPAESDIEGVGGTPGAASGMSGAGGGSAY